MSGIYFLVVDLSDFFLKYEPISCADKGMYLTLPQFSITATLLCLANHLWKPSVG